MIASIAENTSMTEPDYIRAHKFSIYHREQILKSEICGCFFCLNTFTPNEIERWVDLREGIETTALCPKCGIDSVIGSASEFPISEEFLEQMKNYWF